MTDYINRDKAAEYIAGIDIEKYLHFWCKSMRICAVVQLQTDIVDYLVNLPAADVRPVEHGRWIFDDPLRADFMCSACLERQIVCSNYCPYCGADMREEAGDAE